MILPFSTHWPKKMGEAYAGKRNYFVEKIFSGLLELGDPNGELSDYLNAYRARFNREGVSVNPKDVPAKIHTIRHDPHDRWKVGAKIHPVIGNRTKRQFQFAPTMEVVAIQEIEIRYFGSVPEIIIDGRVGVSHREFAWNDGFDSLSQFLAWFREDTKPKTKIIHWTGFKY